jgi:RNA polymerase sigma-70 factor (ECF subfamily)
MEENTIIRGVLDGDIESFRLLVERYQKPVMGMIKNLINDYHGCEDIAQDVFLTAYKELSFFDPARSGFSTWLFTIARNKSLNLIKKKKAYSANNLPEKSGLSSPIDSLVQTEFFEKLDRTLQALPPKQRRAFVLAEFENLSYEQIAQIEGTAIGTIKSRINRAKSELGSVLKELEGDTL